MAIFRWWIWIGPREARAAILGYNHYSKMVIVVIWREGGSEYNGLRKKRIEKPKTATKIR